MPPFTHIVKGERSAVWNDDQDSDPTIPLVEERTSSEVANDISAIETQIIERKGTFLRSYTSNPNDGSGDTIFIVVDYPVIEENS